MWNKLTLLLVVCVALATATPGIVTAQEAAQDNGWEFTLSPYAWAASLKGSTGIGQVDQNIDLNFTDEILDNLNMGAMGDLRAEKGSWAIQTNFLWVELEADANLGPVAANVELTQWVVELDGRYRLNDNWELLAGIRYYDMSVKTSITGAVAGAKTVSEDWIDPIVGIVFKYPLSDRWSIGFSGDIGGFGVGSDFAWQLWGAFDYRFGKSKQHSFTFGWRHLDWDYESGDGNDRFAMDTYMTGPIIGVRFRF